MVLGLADGLGIGDGFFLVKSIGLGDCFSLMDGFRSSGWLWNREGFVLVYSIGLVDCFSLVDGFGIGDSFVLVYIVLA